MAAGHSRPVAHGLILLGLLSRLIGTRLPGPGSLWFDHQIEFADAVAGDCMEVGGGRKVQPHLGCAGYNCLAQRVLRAALGSGYEPQQLLVVPILLEDVLTHVAILRQSSVPLKSCFTT